MWTCIFSFPIILVFILFFFRRRSYDSYKSYQRTNSVVYFLEIYITTLALSCIYISIQFKSWPWDSNLDFDTFFTIFITSFTVYQIIVLVTKNIHKSNNIDGYQSLKTLCERLLFCKKYDNQKEYDKFLKLYNQYNGNTNHRVIPPIVEEYLNDLNRISFNDPKINMFLEFAIIDLNHQIELDGFTWNSSFFLDVLK